MGKLTRDPEVLEAIRGYVIPFASSPPSRVILSEPIFSTLVAKSCDRETLRLFSKSIIFVTVPSDYQFLSPFFIREKPSGGICFVFNLKDLNYFFFHLYIFS